MLDGLTTQLDFYEDPYRHEDDVWVDSCGVDDKGRTYLVLSNTIFHPHGGGQKGDRGALIVSEEIADALGSSTRLAIVDTRRTEHGIGHILGDPVATSALTRELVGVQPVHLYLDWDFRHRQMRLHSTAHLLHCFVEQVLERQVDPPATSDLQDGHGLNRYDEPALVTPEQMQDVLAALNQFVAADHVIATRADTTPNAPDGARLWECESWSIPCGGTHPRSTAEIGTVSADLSTKRGRTSMTFRVDPATSPGDAQHRLEEE